MTTKPLTLSEAAAEILKASQSSGHKDAFGADGKGTKVTPPGQTGSVIELNPSAIVHPLEGTLPDGTKGANKATPPGATPPVGPEPMKKLEAGKTPVPSAKGDADASGADKDDSVEPDVDPKSAVKSFMKKRAANKKDMAEDVAAIFAGEETLTETFKEKAATIFEAAVMSRVDELSEELAEEFTAKLDEEVETIKNELTVQVNDYLNYVVENWVKDNQVAIEKGIRAEIVENFISGMKTLFVENYIDIPDDKVDLVGELSEKVEELTNKLNASEIQNVQLSKSVNEQKKEIALAKLCEGLTDTQAEKIRTLAENVDYNPSDFTKKVQMLKESYFPVDVKKIPTEGLNNETLIEEKEEKKISSDPLIAAVVKSITNSQK